ncbi:MAG TPA: arginine--tRNA ligase [Thermoleophilaceae bacterium]|jgi:arginyl-tRNA synthetase
MPPARPGPSSNGRSTDPIGALAGAVRSAAQELGGAAAATAGAKLERPPRADFGDFSSNAPMLLAPTMREQPRAVAERLGALVSEALGPALERTEVAGPGFLNLFLADAWFRDALGAALAAGDDYGRAPATGERHQVEFVSANPTGPITVASGRHAAWGDSLARILEMAGHEVDREYYVNDHGSQVVRFGESIQARARGEEPPEDGYRGAYVVELAEQLGDAPAVAEADSAEIAQRGVEQMVANLRVTLERFRVGFDRFFSERSLHESGALDRTVALLEERGLVYRHEGAVWLRTTDFGDDKDRVLQRSTGEYTYFAADIAYHQDKRERGYRRIIDLWGADHHGHVARMHAAWRALGGEPDELELLIMQLVNLVERGQRVQMSKRQGEFVTLDDLLDDIGVDATRYFMLERSHDTTLDLDLTKARERSQDNPVYYVQYAHARIASILRKAGETRVEAALAADLGTRSDALHPSERDLLKRLLEFPGEVAFAAERRAPHRLTAYVHDAAQHFSAFYRDCRVAGAAEEGEDEDFRIALSVQAKRVIAASLGVLGVEAPEHM